MLILALPITAISAAFPKEIILFISSPAFLSGSRALVLLSFTLPFIYLDTLLGEVLLANNSRKLLVRIAIVMLSFNFLTNLYFIPKYSFMGAAFTTFISEVLLFAINLYYTKKILPYKIDLEGVIKIILIASATWFFAVIIKDVTSLNFIFISLIALIINLLLLNFTGIFTIQTLREIKNSED